MFRSGDPGRSTQSALAPYQQSALAPYQQSASPSSCSSSSSSVASWSSAYANLHRNFFCSPVAWKRKEIRPTVSYYARACPEIPLPTVQCVLCLRRGYAWQKIIKLSRKFYRKLVIVHKVLSIKSLRCLCQREDSEVKWDCACQTFQRK